VSIHQFNEPLAGMPLPRFRCSTYGYGASRRIAPERSPMCGASTWELDSVGSEKLGRGRRTPSVERRRREHAEQG
jgi:hypothetical protein